MNTPTVVLLALLCAAALAAPWREGVALSREGATLTYNGAPFACVGVNKHELLSQYLVAVRGGSEQELSLIHISEPTRPY